MIYKILLEDLADSPGWRFEDYGIVMGSGFRFEVSAICSDDSEPVTESEIFPQLAIEDVNYFEHKASNFDGALTLLESTEGLYLRYQLPEALTNSTGASLDAAGGSFAASEYGRRGRHGTENEIQSWQHPCYEVERILHSPNWIRLHRLQL
ncbi:hypothetical protein N431DRAFT_564378 [Stipitochalara longipes BDJ]|nr:hypothetical protein N431DRAFT_564378 [Stipitochalara longipes BDJ]